MLSSLPKRINMTQSYRDAPIVAASVHSRPKQLNLSNEKLDEIADHWEIVVTLNDGRKFLVHSTPETGVVATDAKNMSDRWRKSADLAVNGAKTIGGMLRGSNGAWDIASLLNCILSGTCVEVKNSLILYLLQ